VLPAGHQRLVTLAGDQLAAVLPAVVPEPGIAHPGALVVLAVGGPGQQRGHGDAGPEQLLPQALGEGLHERPGRPAAARCTDGACGRVSRVVVDAATMTVTHLVVEPEDRHQLGRLVPLDLLATRSGDISLGCAVAEFFQLARAEERQFVRGTGAFAGYDQGQRVQSYIRGQRPGGPSYDGVRPQTLTYDVLPAGEVAVRGGDPVHAVDGDIGHITGVVMETGSHRVAYVLLHAGHLLDSKNIAIPSRAVTRVDAGIQLDITRQDVKHLPPVNLHESGG
jgi:hypothetical protein